mmetsp:Transcript_53961/g.151660  ORF Transcript_53961/g.151660 Transcript_53961/m.151660 type:complete len:243 (+) Transcript_53961:672-1400(+)
MASGAMAKKCLYKRPPTALTPKACTCSQLFSTAESPLDVKAVRVALAADVCRPSGVHPGNGSSSTLAWSSYSLSRFLSFTMWPRRKPMSFKSRSSMSTRVSMSSKPCSTKTEAYCGKPMSCKNEVTGLTTSASCSCAAPAGCMSFLRRSLRWGGMTPRSSKSASVIAAKVSISSKPFFSRTAVYICKPTSWRNAATTLAGPPGGAAAAGGASRMLGHLDCMWAPAPGVAGWPTFARWPGSTT